MKILYVTDSFPPESVGGAGQVAFDMAKGMIASGHDVAVIAATTVREHAGETVYESIPVHRIFSSVKARFFRSYLAVYNPFIKKEFLKILMRLDPNIVHFHNVHEHFSFAALRWARGTSAAIFITLHDVMAFTYTRLYHFIDPQNPDQHGPFDYHVPLGLELQQMGKSFNPFRNSSIRRSLRSAHHVFSVSQALSDALQQNGISPVTTLYNGINVEDFSTSQEEIVQLRSKLNLKSGPVILFGGRAMQDKGPEELLVAFKRVLEKISDAQLLIAAERNDYFGRLRKISKKHGIEPAVVFSELLHGRERTALFGFASVVVVPSIYFDPAPLMVMQAMAAGKPVIGTCFGGTPEIVEDGVTGFIVNPYDTELFSEKIQGLLVDPDCAAHMGQAGRERIQKVFSLKWQINQSLDYYRAAVDSDSKKG